MKTAVVAAASISGVAAFQSFPLVPPGTTPAFVNAWTSVRNAPRQRYAPPCRPLFMSTLPKPTDAEYDSFLGELVFSSNDVRDDILRNFDRATDPQFLTWLVAKADGSKDLEERAALRSLSEVIKNVAARVEEAALAEKQGAGPPAAVTAAAAPAEPAIADAEVTADRTPQRPRKTNDEIVAEMRRLQGVGAGMGSEADEAAEAEAISPFDGLPEKVKGSYEKMLQSMLDRPAGQTLEEAVEAAYERCDIQFLTLLRQKIAADPASAAAAELQKVVDTVNGAMQRRIELATERLSKILSAGEPMRMEAEIAAMAKRGEVDEPLLLLLEANSQQAGAAGAQGPAQLLRRLQQRVQRELDNKVEPEKRLVRQLLRTNEPAEREKILRDAFRPRAKLQLAGGQETSDAPEVAPPKFIAVVRNLLLNFGNANTADAQFAMKLDAIIAEAEKIATDLYGASQTAQDVQDRMWKEATVSVYDLEKIEDQAEMQGEQAPWMNNKYDAMLPKTFNDKGEWKIGGS